MNVLIFRNTGFVDVFWSVKFSRPYFLELFPGVTDLKIDKDLKDKG